MHDRVPLWEGLCRAVGSDCYRNTTVKYGAITNGVRAHVSQQENKAFWDLCILLAGFLLGVMCVLCHEGGVSRLAAAVVTRAFSYILFIHKNMSSVKMTIIHTTLTAD